MIMKKAVRQTSGLATRVDAEILRINIVETFELYN